MLRQRCRRIGVLLLACGLIGGPGACSDDAAAAPDAQAAADGAHDADRQGCTHLQQGPFADLTAGADPASAAEIKADHRAYRVALTPGQAGYIKYNADASGDHVLFLDQDLKLELRDDQDQVLAPEQSATSVSACTIVKGKHIFELPAVGTYVIGIGPHATATSVTAVIEELGHAH